MSNEIYQKVTDKILECLEAGDMKWVQNWSGTGLPKNFVSKKMYRGINVLMLMMHMQSGGFKQPFYLTFKQAQTLKGSVKKGSKGTMVVYFKTFKVCGTCRKVAKECACPQAQQKHHDVPMMRYYHLFNIEQTEGIEIPEQQKIDFKPIEACESIAKAYLPELAAFVQEGQQAFYRPGTDVLTMPKKEDFKSEEDYYCVLFHELTHSTGHKKRLDRPGVVDASIFGTATYSKEEVIAELGSSFLCGYVGIDKNLLENNAAYIQHWIKNMREDNKFIFKAASEAQKAADLILAKETQVWDSEVIE
jgi:antirestriction protein ArdC